MTSFAPSFTVDMTPEVKEDLIQKLLDKCEKILEEHPDNRCVKYVIEYMKNGEGKALSNEGKSYQYYYYSYSYSYTDARINHY